MSKLRQITRISERAVTLNAGRLTVLAAVLGLISALLGVVVIVGWHAHIRVLVQVYSTYAPMHYNTALCLVWSGLALVAVAQGKRGAAMVLGALVAGFAGLTLLQYPLNADLGLDQLFFKPYLTPRSSHLGRMAPMAATCFSFVGITIVRMTICGRRESTRAGSGLLSAFVVALCVTAIFGYATGLDGADAWSQFSRMALHTAVGLGLLGAGLFALAYCAAFANTGRSPRWLPSSVMLSALMATVVLWRALVTEHVADIANIIEAHAASVQVEINSELQQRVQSLTRMAHRWEFSGAPERAAWEHDAATAVSDALGSQAIEWIDPSLLVRWVAPVQGNEKQPGQQIVSESWRRALNGARETRQPVVTRLDERAVGCLALAICVPIYRANQFDGFIAGLVRVQELLDSILPSSLAAGYSIAIEDGGTIYQRFPSPRPSERQWTAQKKIGVNGIQWTARVWPRPELLTAEHPRFTAALLMTGVLGSMLLGLTVFLAQRGSAEARAAALAGEALQEKQQFLEVLLDNLQAGVIACDAKGKVSLFNRAVQQLHGIPNLNVSSEDVPTCFGLFHPDGKTLLKPEEVPLARALRGETVHEMEVVVAQEDRAPRTLLASGQQIVALTGKKLGAMVALHDITERKQAEKALRKSSDRLSLATESARIGIWEYDLQENTLFWDERMYALYGIRPEEFSGAYEAWERGVHPQDLPAARAELEDAIAGKKEFHTQFRVVWPDGQIHFVEAHAVVQRAPNGTPLRAIGVNWDITERKGAQAELEKLHKQLVEASRRSGMAEIAANVLHNVGNVLNSLNVSTSLIVARVKKSRASGLARVVVLLQEHAHDLGPFITNDAKGKHVPTYLAQLSEQLMADQESIVNELDSLQQNVEHIKEIVAMQQPYATFGGVKEMINVVNLVEDSLRMNEGALERHRVEVVREFEKAPPMNLDKHRMLQILVNLVRNAKHACQDSERADKRLTMRVATGGGRIKITVADNGVGIPPENLTRIFNHGFTTRKSGHGFGLHSGALAAKEMGGSLTVHSDGPGQGAAFTLELPCPARETSHE